jgi:hypothetical protein
MSSFIMLEETISQLASNLDFYATSCNNDFRLYGTKSACESFLTWLETKYRRGKKCMSSVRMIAAALYKLNVQAVNFRYNEKNRTALKAFNQKVPTSEIQTLKTLNCLLYQSSEGKFPESEIFKRLEIIKTALAYDIVTNLPEYDAASWG